MRSALAVIIVILASVAPARADFERSRLWFEQLTDDQRYELQADLTLLGYYDAFADGIFGNGTYRAITRYQGALGSFASGVLSSSELTRIGQLADRAYATWGFAVEDDVSSQATFLLPAKLLTVRKTSDHGSTYSAPDYRFTLETLNVPTAEQDFSSLYNELSAGQEDRQVTYHVIKPDRFVVAGRDNGTLFYSLFLADAGASVGFTMRWAPEVAKDGAIIASFVASHYVPTKWLPGKETAPEVVSQPETRTATAPEPTTAPVGRPQGEADRLQGDWVGGFYLPEALPNVILLAGEIGTSTPLEFLRALKARPETKVVALNSPGGLVDPALVIALEVRERGLSTLIIDGNGCYSACAFIYFAGIERIVLGELGVHQLWNEGNNLVSGQAKLSDVLEALDEFNAPREVLSVMLRTPPDQMHVFSPAEVTQLKLNSGDPRLRLEFASPQATNPVQTGGWGGSTEVAPKESKTSHTRTVTFTTSSTTTIRDLLEKQAVTASSVAAVVAVFRSSFNVAVVPKNVRVTLFIGKALSGEGEVPLRVDLRDLPSTYYNGTGKAAVTLTPDGFYVKSEPL